MLLSHLDLDRLADFLLCLLHVRILSALRGSLARQMESSALLVDIGSRLSGLKLLLLGP